MTDRPPEPDFETLVDWVDGRLAPERADEVAALVRQADARTLALVEWLRGFVRLGKQFPIEDVPAIVRQRLQVHYLRWRDTEAAVKEEIRHFDAHVLFDSRTGPVLTGVRGSAPDDVLHIAFTSDAADIVLDVRRLVGHRVRVDGQVLPVGESTAPVFEASISGPTFTIRTLEGDQLGRFRLDDVPDSATRLEVTNGEITVSAPLALSPTVS